MRIWPKLWVPGSPHVLASESVIWVNSELPESPRVRMVILISKAVWSLFSCLLSRIFNSANSSGYVDFYSVNGVVSMGVYWTLNHILAGLWQWLVAVFPPLTSFEFLLYFYVFITPVYRSTTLSWMILWRKNCLFVAFKLILLYSWVYMESSHFSLKNKLGILHNTNTRSIGRWGTLLHINTDVLCMKQGRIN
jgi:hypothetical protein